MDASYGVPFRAVSCRCITPRAVPAVRLAQSKSQQLQSSVHSLPAAKPLTVIRYYE